MNTSITDITDQQLRNLIENHRAKKATNRPLYLEALAEQARRSGKGLSFETSFGVIHAAAAEGRFVSYKELADASGADWNRVRYAIGGHLWSLVEYADRRGWPMLSAIVVNKGNVATGDMEPSTLKGFIDAARELGHPVTDEKAFLREQQQRVFDWARS